MGKDSKEKKSVMQSVGELKNFLPPELVGMPTMQICGNREITLDGCKGIIEYSDFEIKMRTANGGVSVFGKNLNIKYLSINSVVIEGKIRAVEFGELR